MLGGSTALGDVIISQPASLLAPAQTLGNLGPSLATLHPNAVDERFNFRVRPSNLAPKAPFAFR